MFCLLDVKWRGQDSMMLVMEGKRYKLWWSLKEDGVGAVGVLVKQMCMMVVAVRRVSDRVMAVEVVFEEDLLMVICGYAP